MNETWAIIVAGGRGDRFGADQPKQFLTLAGRPMVEYSLQLFRQLKIFQGIVLVLPEAHVAQWQAKFPNIRVTAGGATRQQSVQRGLAQVEDTAQYVAIHDAARPLVTAEIAQATCQAAYQVGAAVAAVAVADTLKKGDQSKQVLQTVPRDQLYRIQTPQVFARQLLDESLQWAQANQVDATDEATLVEKMGRPVQLVMASEFNFKITQSTDLAMAEAILSQQNKESSKMRIGEGYDVHPFAEGRDLILGGVKIPFEKGLQGHSDADALSHAIGDALLGAIAEGDLGAHFPDSDARWKGVSSLMLLAEIRKKCQKKGFRLANVDATVICQRPKLAAHIPKMRENIAQTLQVSLDQVSIKATTEEGLGFTGNMQGLAARAVVLLKD